jgi:hypothetical protein
MKRFVAIVAAVVFMAACAKKAEFVPPTSWAAIEASAINPGPGQEMFMWAVGSGPTADQEGVLRPYACFVIYHGENVQFPCPAAGK